MSGKIRRIAVLIATLVVSASVWVAPAARADAPVVSNGADRAIGSGNSSCDGPGIEVDFPPLDGIIYKMTTNPLQAYGSVWAEWSPLTDQAIEVRLHARLDASSHWWRIIAGDVVLKRGRDVLGKVKWNEAPANEQLQQWDSSWKVMWTDQPWELIDDLEFLVIGASNYLNCLMGQNRLVLGGI
jgi:hypothetical protein